MVSLKNILLLVSTVTAAAISKRDVNVFFSDLDTINTNSVTIVPIVTSWTGDLTGALKINATQNAINTAVLQAGTDTLGIFTPITDDQIHTLFGKVDTITANLGTLANAFKAKKPIFDKAGFTPVVLSQITTVSTSFHLLALDATRLVGVGYQSAAQAKADAIGSVLKDLLVFFGGVV